MNTYKKRTISRRLVANGLHSCRPLRRLPLTPPNRRQRLEWCRARSTWMTEWHRVVFSDESRFCLSSDSRRVRVWRRRGERSNPAAIVERPTVRQRGIMVWGAIAVIDICDVHLLNGTILDLQVFLFRIGLHPEDMGTMGDDFDGLTQSNLDEGRVLTSPMRGWPVRRPQGWPRRSKPVGYLNDQFFESLRTISRRLVANGLYSCRPLRRLPLTPPNRRQRLEWCWARSTWMTEWHRVVFSDESRFCLSSDSRRVRVWRRRGERSNPAAIVERPTVRQRGIMVWGAIAYDSRSPLLRIQGTMTVQRYVDDVLRPVTLPYLQGVPNALYQQDNARPHTARISQQALQDVQMLPWPPYSSDLSPIEHVWDIIGRRLHALPQPRSEDELWQMVEREWRAIPQDAIRTLIDSLPRRVAACIAVRGGPTCY
ncbi:Transposase [Cordylochernes scorpioides]|uniref:Transposase n=1 Tax=Cordylochernes scorpioides TaxID=51811 RepID=A0ABY6KXY0_9ARAC|nr:Transposase [Cordylochernes scorpioides]